MHLLLTFYIFNKINFYLKNKNIGILITDHNVNETLSITDRAYLLFEGSILKAGSAEELAADEIKMLLHQSSFNDTVEFENGLLVNGKIFKYNQKGKLIQTKHVKNGKIVLVENNKEVEE